MTVGSYYEFMHQTGNVTIPVYLIDKLQALDISPEEMGYLVLALAKPKQESDPWTGWALSKGWAKWEGTGEARRIVFAPLWDKLYQLWQKEQSQAAAAQQAGQTKADFDFSRILKELDRLRGSLSVTTREQQLIQEFNLKYGWSTDFILTFFQLCFQRGLTQLRAYRPLATQINRTGIYTLEGLISFMDNVDWISQKATEIKKDYLGLYGLVTVTERDLYVKWNVHWQFSHTVILRAAQETVGANNASFKYLDKILEDWHLQGVTSLETAEKAIAQRTAQKKADRDKKLNQRVEGVAPKADDNRRMVKRGNKNWEGIE
jgi:DnaD/phage-associated family protein